MIMKPSRVYAVVIVLALGTVLLVNGYSVQTRMPGVNLPSATSVGSADGLRLYLSVDTAYLASGQSANITVSEVNTLA